MASSKESTNQVIPNSRGIATESDPPRTNPYIDYYGGLSGETGELFTNGGVDVARSTGEPEEFEQALTSFELGPIGQIMKEWPETPNKDHIDRFLEQMYSRYEYEKLRQWSLDDLTGEEWNVRSKIEIFKVGFPHKQSALQGTVRQFASDDPTDDKQALTDIEQQRLYQAKEDMIANVKRARGTKKSQRRKERTDYVEAMAKIPLSIYATVKELKFW